MEVASADRRGRTDTESGGNGPGVLSFRRRRATLLGHCFVFVLAASASENFVEAALY